MTTLPFHTPSFDDAGETERLDHADHAIFRARARLHVEHPAYRRAPAPQPVDEAFEAVLERALEAPSRAPHPRATVAPHVASPTPTASPANGKLLGVGLIATACAIFAYAGVELYDATRPAPVTFVESPRAPSPAPDPTPPREPLVEVAAPAPAAHAPAVAAQTADAAAPARTHLEARRFAEALAAARTLDRGAARDALEAEIHGAWTAHVERLPANGVAERARRDAALTQLVAAAPQHDGARALAARVRGGYAAERARLAKRIPAWRRIEVRPVDTWGRVVDLVLTSPMDTEMAEMMRLQPLLAPAAAHGELMGMAAEAARDTTVEVRAAHTYVDGLKSAGRADAACLRRLREHADYACIKFSDR